MKRFTISAYGRRHPDGPWERLSATVDHDLAQHLLDESSGGAVAVWRWLDARRHKDYVRVETRGGKPMCETDFGWALKKLRDGRRMCRSGWNGKGMWLELQTPDEHSKMTLPYIYMRTAGGHLVPWLASQTDMLSTDWEIVSQQ